MSALGAFLLVATLVALLLIAHHAKKKPRIRKKTDQFLAEVRANDPTAETRSAGALPSRAVLNTIKPSNPQGAVSLPLNVLAVDVETTGLEADDRVVSLGIIM